MITSRSSYIKKRLLNDNTTVFLEMCILSMYSLLEGQIRIKTEELLTLLNNKYLSKVNNPKFVLKESLLIPRGILNQEKMKQLCKNIGLDLDIKIDSNFIKARNYIAHGNNYSIKLDKDIIKKYLENIKDIIYTYEDSLSSYIQNKKYLA